MHLVRRGHFPSRDKDDGHNNRSTVVENATLQCKNESYQKYEQTSYARLLSVTDKNGGYTMGSAIPENPMLHANPGTLSFL